MTLDPRPLLAKIHIAKKDLGLSDDEYRDILYRVTKKRSSSKMTFGQLESVIRELKTLGWKNAAPKKEFRKTSNSGIRKIYALWGELQSLGAVTSGDKTALDAFVKKHTGVDSAQWLDVPTAQRVIEILKQWLKRIGG